jgi:hypothetical protein
MVAQCIFRDCGVAVRSTMSLGNSFRFAFAAAILFKIIFKYCGGATL